MTAGVGPRGRLPWSGTRARSRELGYGDGMREMAMMLDQICRDRPDLKPYVGWVSRYAWDAWMMTDPDGGLVDYLLNCAGLRPEAEDSEVSR